MGLGALRQAHPDEAVLLLLAFLRAVDYKTGDLERDLRERCPGGVDVFYDNVGGETLDTVLRLINTGARIVIGGAISAYNATEPVPGPYNMRMLLVRRARMEGFIIFDYRDRYAEATAQRFRGQVRVAHRRAGVRRRRQLQDRGC